ncbi:MAG: ankyrin repeat domain-containing protein, partial [Phycisphaerae bacterium]|nr:ankyrin repeat domain-containing protein [Phycisphaerae bacterium]
AKVNMIDGEEKWTALMFAAAEGQTATVKTLLDHGANWKMLDIDGESARDFAASKNHTETVNVLDTFAKSKASKE